MKEDQPIGDRMPETICRHGTAFSCMDCIRIYHARLVLAENLAKAADVIANVEVPNDEQWREFEAALRAWRDRI